jgi:hypothetical protein
MSTIFRTWLCPTHDIRFDAPAVADCPQCNPVEPAPVEPAPVEPVEPAPVEPVEPAPVEPAPVE